MALEMPHEWEFSIWKIIKEIIELNRICPASYVLLPLCDGYPG
jgi:hypothetical protein